MATDHPTRAPWLLTIDESGDFTDPGQTVCLGGPLSDAAGSRAIGRLSETLRQHLPFLHAPSDRAPLHTAHLRSPLYVALSWHVLGPPALLRNSSWLSEAGLTLSEPTRAAIRAVRDGLTPGVTNGELACAELEEECRRLGDNDVCARVLSRVCTLLRYASQSAMLPMLRRIGFAGQVATAMAVLRRHQSRALDAAVSQLRAGRRPDLAQLKQMERWLRRHRPRLLRSLQSGRSACLAFVRRAVRSLSAQPGTVCCCFAAEPGGEVAFEGRYDALLRAAMGRGLRIAAHLAADELTNRPSPFVDVCAASVHIPDVDGLPYEGPRREQILAWLREETTRPLTARAGEVRVRPYEDPNSPSLFLADWSVNNARHAIRSAEKLSELQLAILALVGLPAEVGPRDLPSVTSAQEPAAWLAEGAPPLLAGRPLDQADWAWEQAAAWAAALPPSPTGRDAGGATHA